MRFDLLEYTLGQAPKGMLGMHLVEARWSSLECSPLESSRQEASHKKLLLMIYKSFNLENPPPSSSYDRITRIRCAHGTLYLLRYLVVQIPVPCTSAWTVYPEYCPDRCED